MFTIKNTTIRDEYGRERIFRGWNICFKLREFSGLELFRNSKYVDKALDIMEDNGVNLVRLGVTWSALEPAENQYDQKAFDYFKDYIKECQKRNIYVLLDCHQDLFCDHKGVGDGAPEWLTAGYKKKKPLVIWAEGYFYMRDVQRAFNDFWSNKNGMQDKFVSLWNKIVDELGSFDNVIGYDYFNEPMINDNSNKIFCSMIDGACREGLGFDFNASKYFENGRERLGFIRMSLALFRKIKTVKNLELLLKNLDNYDAFKRIIEPNDKYVIEFNEKYYQPFVDRMISSCGDDNHFNFIEHSYYNNLGLPFEINTNGNTIYSPHAYDVFIDSPLYNSFSSDARIQYILDGIKANQDKMGIPVVMGEWGGGANNGNAWLDHIDYIYNQIEDNKWSSIYWAFRFRNKEFVHMMNRPYPVAVCGDIISYHTDSKSRQFSLEYECKENTAKTIIYINGKGFVEFDNQIGKNIISFAY